MSDRAREVMIHEVMTMCYEQGIEEGKKQALAMIKEVMNESGSIDRESGEGPGGKVQRGDSDL